MRWLVSKGSVYRDARQRPLRLLGIHLDITERKQAEQQLRQLSLALEQSPDGVFITDTQARIEYVNAAFLAISGYRQDEVIGQTPALLRSGLTPRATYIALRDAINQGQRWHGEFINRRKDGSHYQVLATVSPIRQESGIVTHVCGGSKPTSPRRNSLARSSISIATTWRRWSMSAPCNWPRPIREPRAPTAPRAPSWPT